MRHDRDHDHGKQIKFEVLTITHEVEILQTIWGHYRDTYIYIVYIRYFVTILAFASRHFAMAIGTAGASRKAPATMPRFASDMI